MAVELHASDLSKPIVLRNIAVTYRRCEHIPEAIEWFNRALAIDADFALAGAGLALAYASETKNGPKPDWEQALFHCNMVLDHIKQGKPVFSGQEPDAQIDEYFQWKASWLRKLSRYEEACAIYNELLLKDPTDDQIRLELIYTFCEAQTYGNVVEMLQELQKEVDEETKRTTLSRFFRTHGNDPKYHHTIVQAFKQTGNVSEIKSHYRAAVEDFKLEKTKDWATNETRWNISYHFGVVLYTHANATSEKSEAVEVWEQILAKVAAEHRYMEPVMLSAKRLARLYIAKAIEAGSGSAMADEMLTKVRAFAPASNGEDGKDEDAKGMGLSHAEVRALVGRFYSAVGDIEKAKDEIRPSVDVGIKLLSDEDPENDWQGYAKLADALMHFQDDANAIAAWSLVQPTEGLPITVATTESNSLSASNAGFTNEDLRTDTANGAVVEPSSQSAAKTEESNGADSDDSASFKPPPLRRANTSRTTRSMQGPISYSCDGRCGKRWTYSDDIYVCRECVDVQFDAGCIEKLLQGNIGRDICDPNHTVSRFMGKRMIWTTWAPRGLSSSLRQLVYV
jgi:tetratricopeptide (TPR) repeat protein